MPSDPSHALERLLAEAPNVRLLARTLAASEADEVEQQTWLQAFEHGGEGVDRPRPWLLRIVRNVVANLHRGSGRRRSREATAASDAEVPSSVELLANEEQRRRLVTAVDGLPSAIRAVVLLRYFEGLPPRDVATRLGLPVATVWNRLRQAMRLLRTQLDAEHGGRAAWAVPLAILFDGTPRPQNPLVPALPQASTPLFLAAILMATKTKLAAVAGAILIVAGVVAWQLDMWSAASAPEPSGGLANTAATGAFERELQGAATAGDQLPAAEREAVPEVTAPTTGSVLVRVRYERDGSAAAHVGIQLRRTAGDHRFQLRRETDAHGEVRFEQVLPGRFWLTTMCAHRPATLTVAAGDELEVDYSIETGVNVRGVVVDSYGAPVAGALVEHAPPSRADCDLVMVAVSDGNGEFAIRDLRTSCLIGARAPGYCASRLAYVSANKGSSAEVRLELTRGGGSIEGVVVDLAGRAIVGAVLAIGEGRVTGIRSGTNGGDPPPAVVETDASGRFLAVGIPAGKRPVEAAASGQAHWHGECDVTADVTVPMRIVMGQETEIRGIVVGDDDAPIEGAEVSVGPRNHLGHVHTRSAANGTFSLRGLAPGEHTVSCHDEGHGKAEVEVTTSAHAPTECRVRLLRGLELKGRVVDDGGKPIGRAYVSAQVSAPPMWAASAEADGDGRFTLGNCPLDRRIWLQVRASDFVELRRFDVDPKAGPVELAMARQQPATVQVRGRVLGPNGQPLANTWLSLQGRIPGAWGRVLSGEDGRFELQRVVPGEWRASLHHPDHPLWWSEWRTLAAHDEWDVGEIRLPEGGTARITVEGDREGLYLRLFDRTSGGGIPMQEQDGVYDSIPLAPGPHEVLVSGARNAMQVVRFQVTAGHTAQVPVRLRTGIAQLVECDTRSLGESLGGVTFVVRRGDDRIGSQWASGNGGVAKTGLFLSPGDYTLDVTEPWQGTVLATTSLTIGDKAGAAVRLTAR